MYLGIGAVDLGDFFFLFSEVRYVDEDGVDGSFVLLLEMIIFEYECTIKFVCSRWHVDF